MAAMRIATFAACVGAVAALGLAQGRSPRNEIATFGTLPAPFVRGNSEALAVDEAGTVIAGHSTDGSDRFYAVKWTLQTDGSWGITLLPWPPNVNSTTARGVNNRGDVAGNDFPGSASRPLLWLAGTGTPLILGCSSDFRSATVNGISADAQVIVGVAIDFSVSTSTGAVWRPDGNCREDLPLLVAGDSAGAYAVNGDGTVIGGRASGFPVRWSNEAGQWQIVQLDTDRAGIAYGANGVGDLAGQVTVACALQEGCSRAVIWYAADGWRNPRDLGTLGGEQSWAHDINASGEVVGMSSPPQGVDTAFFWSESMGMVQLPFKGRWAAANAVSDLRPDGTRLVVGRNSQGQAVTWLVQNP